ncbi:camphor resistance protein CrcB [Bacillus xiamenensis]|uniref:Fluoride-specific ion channel FluC n=1 Tax=Bacillus xiamenensis TaxID=1178537 RepID=A0AAC9IG98_9BACI|nr:MULTISPECIES: fluoride efflux transporter CrcB [Bacillus]AOZ87839.1 camphor resistance protein CrcB [Bacillus xiamenensis]EKF34763.1 camphor resistance protein CrcB1 [Bacillus xiamenensis]MBG9910798.1 camphor resistance protein CrcB [Bacillus xiamenensis]MCW1837787.1 fluoride efflux transporter CrcB [Bacillus xiamenensis]MCY9577197.1 fluoride efflux transporter CrcB [Bacillus xiamenensis]
MIVLYTAVAGGIGSVFRFFISQMLQKTQSHARFPYSILLINLLGAAGLGFLTGAVTSNHPLLVIIGTGFFGGFTTFSTFSIESATMLLQHQIGKLAVYLFATMIGSLCLFAAFDTLGQLLF